MLHILLQGLLFGLAYVAPIGTQNLYVINAATGKSRFKTYRTALITVFFDISLAISCFFGIGLIISKFPVLKGIILLLGSIIVIYIGISLIRSSSQSAKSENQDDSLKSVIFSCFSVTWLNPQAILDGSLLLGGFRASLPDSMSKFFILGVCLASLIWFNTLATAVFYLKSKFGKAIKWINIVCGIMLLLYGLKLLYSFFLMLKPYV